MTRPVVAPSTRLPQRDIVVLGMRLRYVDVPARGTETGPPLLLVHGHGSRIEEYDALIPHVSEGRRVIVPDLPGSGYSDKPDRSYSLRLYEDALLGLLDGLGVNEAHVGGGSLGGNLALRLAHREPERLPRIAAWAPASSWEKMHGWARFADFARRLRWLFFPSLWVQSRFWYSAHWAGRRAALEGAWKYYREVYGPGFHRMYWDIGRDQAVSSLFDIAHQIRQPIWLGVGDKDNGLGMFEGVKRLATMLPNVKLRVFAGARHSLANEEVDTLGPEVDRFLRGG